MATLSPSPKLQIINANGPVAGGVYKLGQLSGKLGNFLGER